MGLKNFIWSASLILFLGLSSPHEAFSQQKKPKVALVLSGGGAKGLAHIPLLQQMDSLGIVPDLVVGNSMGSIVGALYAVGYSGDSIASIAHSADWDKLMGGGISLRNVSIEEKSEFGRYLIHLNIEEGKVRTSNALINDQNLREFITSLTYPIYRVEHFDELAIPFRAVATDIVNGKEVILESGSLAFAMRASMSIPGVFSVVPYQETLLIDGGVLNNFPVDIAKNMGADIIIGSDVGGNMLPKEELESLSALFFQAGMLNSYLKNPSNRALCDILFDHLPNLTYSTADFDRSEIMMEEGKIAVADNLMALADLAMQLKKFEQRPHNFPEVRDAFELDTVVYQGVSEGNLQLIAARTGIDPGHTYSHKELLAGIDRAMGTTRFNSIIYDLSQLNGQKGLELRGMELSKHQLKGSLHFDTDIGVGLILNYTGINILGKSSRSLATIDIAQQPRFRLQHQKTFGPEKKWWWRSEAMGQQQQEKIFVLGRYAENLRYRNGVFNNELNRNFNDLKNHIGLGVKYELTQFQPTIDPDINDNLFQLDRYRFQTVELYAQYRQNTMDEVFFPVRGTRIQGYLGRSLYSDVDLIYSFEAAPPVQGSTNGFTKFGLNYELRVPISGKTSGIFGAAAHFILEDNDDGNTNSFIEYGLGAKYFLGGNRLNPRFDTYVFQGLNQSELIATQFLNLRLGAQFNIARNIYITPHANLASVGFGGLDDYLESALSPNGEWPTATDPSFLMSSGASFSYKSILGPITFDVSWVNRTNNVRFFFGLGFPFNKS